MTLKLALSLIKSVLNATAVNKAWHPVDVISNAQFLEWIMRIFTKILKFKLRNNLSEFIFMLKIDSVNSKKPTYNFVNRLLHFLKIPANQFTDRCINVTWNNFFQIKCVCGRICFPFKDFLAKHKAMQHFVFLNRNCLHILHCNWWVQIFHTSVLFFEWIKSKDFAVVTQIIIR